jgi:hypothetical protein
MTRRERIRFTVDRIKVTRSLAARLAEFIEIARNSGYEPVQSMGTLERLQSELKEQRAALARLTVSGQREFVRRQAQAEPIRRKAA